MADSVQPLAPDDPPIDALRARLEARRRARLGISAMPGDASDDEVNLDIRLREMRRQRAQGDFRQGQSLRAARESLARPTAADVTATDRSKFPPAPEFPSTISGLTPGQVVLNDASDRLEREATKRGKIRALSPGAGPAAFVERAVGRALAHAPGGVGDYGENLARMGEEHQREESLGRETLPWVATLPADIGNLWLELEAGGKIPGPIGRIIGKGYTAPVRASITGELAAPGIEATAGRILGTAGREAARFGTLEATKGVVEEAPPEQVFENTVRGMQSGGAWGAGTQALREGVARLIAAGIRSGRVGVERSQDAPPRYFWIRREWETPQAPEALSGTKPGSPYAAGQEVHTPPAPAAAPEAPLPEPLQRGGMQQLEEDMAAGKYTPVQLKQLRARLFTGQRDLTPEKQQLALRVVDSIDQYLQSKGVAGASPVEQEGPPGEAEKPGQALHDTEGKPIPGTEVPAGRAKPSAPVEPAIEIRLEGTRDVMSHVGIVSRNTVPGEKPWRISYWVGDNFEGAPSGHHDFDSKEAALASAAADGFQVTGQAKVRAEHPPAATTEPGPADIVQRPTSEIVADPARFQFKNLGDEGVSPELKGVTKWNPHLAGVISVWKDPADGRTYVVNGHHRLELAKRLGVDRVNVQYIDAPNAKMARAEGAYMNIAEGRGTATDVAKFMRDMEQSPAELEKRGVSLKGDLAKNGVALSKLAPDIFDRVAVAKVPTPWGVAIGGELADQPDLQRTTLKLAEESKQRLSGPEVAELAKQVRAAGTEGVSQESLFGTQQGEASLFVPRAQLSAALQKNLAADKRLFSYVSKGARPEELGRAGATKIDVGAARDLAQGSAKLEELFTRLSTRTGPLADVLTSGARRIAHGEKPGDVARTIYPAVRGAIEQELGGLSGKQGGERSGSGAHGTEHQKPQVEGSVAAETAAEAEQSPAVETSKDVNQNKLLEPRQIVADTAKQIMDAVTKALRPPSEPESAEPELRRYNVDYIDAREHAITAFGSLAESKRAAQQVVKSAGRSAQIDLFDNRPAPLDAAAREAAVARADVPHAWVSIKGQSPKTPEELHGLLWPFRSPIMERLHFLLIGPDGRVLEHQMHTSGVINTVQMHDQFADDLVADMKRVGAVEAVLAHNHPSGDPKASSDDISFTGWVGRRLAQDGLALRGQYVIDDVKGTWIKHHDTVGYSLHDVKLARDPDPADWTATHGPRVIPTGAIDVHTGVRHMQVQDMAQVVLATSKGTGRRLDVLYFNTQATTIALEAHTLDAARNAHEWLPKRLKALSADYAVAVVGGSETEYHRAVMGFRAARAGVMDVFHVTTPAGQAHPNWTSAAARGLIALPRGAGANVFAHRVFERSKGSGSDLPAKRPAEAVSPKNRGLFKGRPFWSGVVDMRDGVIERTFTYEQAEATDFHHNQLLDDATLEAIRDGEKAYFWIDTSGTPRTIADFWAPEGESDDVDGFRPELRAKILAQIQGPPTVAEPHHPYKPAKIEPDDKIISPATLMGGRVHRGLHHGESFERAEKATQRRLKSRRQGSIAHTPEQMQDDFDGLDGFIVRRANGKEQFVSRAQALKIAYLNGQLAAGPGPKLKSIEDYPHEGELISESLDPSDLEDPPLYQPGMFGAEEGDEALTAALQRDNAFYQRELPKERGAGREATLKNIRDAVKRFQEKGVSPSNPHLQSLRRLAGLPAVPTTPTPQVPSSRSPLAMRPQDEDEQGSMFGAKAGTAASRSLSQAESDARARLTWVNLHLTQGKLSDAKRRALLAEKIQLEKLVNRDRALTPAEIAAQAAASETPAEPADPSQTTLFEDKNQYHFPLDPPATGPIGSAAADLEKDLPLPEPAGFGARSPGVTPGRVLDALRAIFNPESFGRTAKATAGVIRAGRAVGALELTRAQHSLRALSKLVGKLDKRQSTELWDAVEHWGAPGTREKAEKLGVPSAMIDGFEATTAKFTDALEELGILEPTIAHYVGRYWAGPTEKMQGFMARIFGRRPLEGPKSFAKKRSFDLFAEGLRHGLRPLTYNFVDSQMFKFAEMQRAIDGRRMVNEELAAGRAKKVMGGAEPPSDADGDWVRIGDGKDPAFTIYGPREIEVEGKSVPVFGRRIMGHFYAPRQSAAIWNNALSRGLRGHPIYDALMAPGQAAAQVILGLSGFHGVVIGQEAMFSEMALGRLPQAAVAPVRGVVTGRRIMQEYQRRGTHPELARVLDAMVQGGFRSTRSSELWSGDRRARFKDALRQAINGEGIGKKLAGAARVPFDALWAAIEASSFPTMGFYVPHQKAFATYVAVERALRDLPAGTGIDEVRRVMGDLVKEMDYRFGQVQYENHFINNVAKDLAQLVFLAPGWTGGTLQLAGRGIRQAGRLAREAVGGAKGELPIGSSSLRYWLAAFVGLAIFNGLLTYLLTGEMPEGKDFLAFRDGSKDEAGNANRYRLPGYIMHDLYAWSHHPGRTLGNKLSPGIHWAYAVGANRSFNGDAVYDPNASWPDILKQIAVFTAKSNQPISTANIADARGRGERGPLAVLPGLGGISPAPREFVVSDAQNLMSTFLRSSAPSGATPAEAEQRQVRTDIAQRFRTRELSYADARTALISAGLRPDQVSDALRRMMGNPLVERFKQLTLEQARQVYDLGSAEEKRLWGPALFRKVAEAHPRNPPRAPRPPSRR